MGSLTGKGSVRESCGELKAHVTNVMGASLIGWEHFESQDSGCKLVLKFGGH